MIKEAKSLGFASFFYIELLKVYTKVIYLSYVTYDIILVMKRKITAFTKKALAILAATAINIILSQVASKFFIPLYMDSIGTILIAALFGMIPAIMTAVLTNGLLIIFGLSYWAFLLCHLTTAVIAALVLQKSKTINSFLLVGILATITNTAIGSPYAIAKALKESDAWSTLLSIDNIHKGLYLATQNIIFSFIYGGFVTNFLDKILSVFFVSRIYSLMTKSNVYIKNNPMVNLYYIIMSFAIAELIFTGILKYSIPDDRVLEFYTQLNKGFDLINYSSMLIIIFLLLLIMKDRQSIATKILKQKTIDEENSKLCNSLRDGALQNLADAEMMIQKRNLQKAQYWIDEAIKNLRFLCTCHDIHKNIVFADYIHNSLQVFNMSYKIDTTFYAEKDWENIFCCECKNELKNIVNELLTNIQKHSGATKVDVKLLLSGENHIIDITDNGKGFREETINKVPKNKQNLANLRKQIKDIGGSIEFINLASRDSHGTQTIITLPPRS